MGFNLGFKGLIIFILFIFYYRSERGQTDISGVAIFRKVYSVNWK